MSRLIKKYKNRRLYDTETSQYITMDELQRYVLDGLIFHVEDSSTGKDITNATLLQILVEMENGTSQLLSAEVLRHLISMAHHTMSKITQGMMEQMITTMEKQLQGNTYLNDYQQVMAQWREFFKK